MVEFLLNKIKAENVKKLSLRDLFERYYFACILSLILCFLWWVGSNLYHNFYFHSDGFHYYYAIRNFLNGHGLYEGPTFEYLLGVHSYLTFCLLIPIFKIFPTPLILLGLTPLLHLFSAYLIYRVMKELTGISNIFVRSAAGILYLLYPVIFGQILGKNFLFEPDYFLPPLSLLLVLACLRRSKRALCWLTVLIVGTKEEYIPLFPLLLFWSLWLCRFASGNQKRLAWKDLCVVIPYYVITSAIALVVLFYFKNLNSTSQVVVAFDIRAILSSMGQALWLLFTVLALYPLAPLIFVVFCFCRDSIKAALLFCILVFVVGRFGASLFIYGSLDLEHWTNIVFPVQLLLVLIVGVGELWKRKKAYLYCLLFAAVIGSVGLCLLVDKQSSAWKQFKQILQSTEKNPENQEILEIAKIIPSPGKKSEYYLTSGYYIYPFVKRSHMSFEWWNNKYKDPVLQEKILNGARFVVVKKTDEWLRLTQFPMPGFRAIKNTEHFILLWRD